MDKKSTVTHATIPLRPVSLHHGLNNSDWNMKALSRVIGSEEGRRAKHGNNALRNLIEERGRGWGEGAHNRW